MIANHRKPLTLYQMSVYVGYIALGLGAGLLSGCFGVGGGALLVPALMLFFNIPYHVAVGTSLALIIPISLAGSVTNFKMGTIHWGAFTACAITGALGAVLGAILVQHIPALYAKRAFSVFLLYAAWRIWSK